MINYQKDIIQFKYKINQQDRENLHKHQGLVFWFTGFSGSGKSTIANQLEQNLYSSNVSTYIIDGDNIRYGLCKDLDFTIEGRKENIRRVIELVKIMIDAGLVVIVTLISPYNIDRKKAKEKIGEKKFIEIFIDTPLSICKKRDPKGLYKKAKLGKIINFTGVNSVYEKPKNPNIYLDGTKPVEYLIQKILKYSKPFLELAV